MCQAASARIAELSEWALAHCISLHFKSDSHYYNFRVFVSSVPYAALSRRFIIVHHFPSTKARTVHSVHSAVKPVERCVQYSRHEKASPINFLFVLDTHFCTWCARCLCMRLCAWHCVLSVGGTSLPDYIIIVVCR